MDVTPTNEVERGFTIGVVVFALAAWQLKDVEHSVDATGVESLLSLFPHLHTSPCYSLFLASTMLPRWVLRMLWAASLPA